MALNTAYLARLDNAHHEEVTDSISTHVDNVEIDNATFITAATALHQARIAESKAYHNSLIDPLVVQIRKADNVQDAYVSAVRGVLRGHSYLPDTEANKAKALSLLQYFKNYDLQITDSTEAEIAKIRNLYEDYLAHKADLEALGVWEYMKKAHAQALVVESLIRQRVDEKAEVITGELRMARKATDAAIREVYDLLEALDRLSPAANITTLINQLKSIESRSRQYYIKTSGSSDTTPVTPEDGGDEDSSDDGDQPDIRKLTK